MTSDAFFAQTLDIQIRQAKLLRRHTLSGQPGSSEGGEPAGFEGSAAAVERRRRPCFTHEPSTTLRRCSSACPCDASRGRTALNMSTSRAYCCGCLPLGPALSVSEFVSTVPHKRVENPVELSSEIQLQYFGD